jgi:hypothetical protein
MKAGPMITATGLAALSVAVIAVASWVQSNISPAQPAINLLLEGFAAVLWIAAAASLIEGIPGRLSRWLRWSLVAYGVAFALPAAITHGANGDQGRFGFEAFYLALLFVTQVWLANPLYLAGLAFARRGWPVPGAVVIGVAVVMGLTLAQVRPEISVNVGYIVWLAGMAIAAVACLADRFVRPVPIG